MIIKCYKKQICTHEKKCNLLQLNISLLEKQNLFLMWKQSQGVNCKQCLNNVKCISFESSNKVKKNHSATT